MWYSINQVIEDDLVSYFCYTFSSTHSFIHLLEIERSFLAFSKTIIIYHYNYYYLFIQN